MFRNIFQMLRFKIASEKLFKIDSLYSRFHFRSLRKHQSGNWSSPKRKLGRNRSSFCVVLSEATKVKFKLNSQRKFHQILKRFQVEFGLISFGLCSGTWTSTNFNQSTVARVYLCSMERYCFKRLSSYKLLK